MNEEWAVLRTKGLNGVEVLATFASRSFLMIIALAIVVRRQPSIVVCYYVHRGLGRIISIYPLYPLIDGPSLTLAEKRGMSCYLS